MKQELYGSGEIGPFRDVSLYTREKIDAHNGFFEKLIQEFDLKKVDADIVIVLHILPDALPFVTALQKIGDINTIIPKPKSINWSSFVELKALPINQLNRDIIHEVLKTLRKRTVFLDIGGYFSPITNEIEQTLGENFCGVVEDTENGMQKYENKGIKFPFLSVARSPLKDNEDIMVGQAISFSAEAILRQHNIVFNGLQVGVIGYGKVGRAVAHQLELRQGRVSINDLDNIRLTHAVSAGFNVLNRNRILGQSDVLCLATGNRSLSGDEYSRLKTGSWLFCVTSSDDELDKSWLEENYDKEQISQHVTRYLKGDHFFYLLNEGNAMNFIHGASVGDFILLVQAELLIATYKLMTHDVRLGEYELDRKTRDKICNIWLSHFRMKTIE